MFYSQHASLASGGASELLDSRGTLSVALMWLLVMAWLKCVLMVQAVCCVLDWSNERPVSIVLAL